MRVFVELAQSVDPSTWAARNAEGLAADASPYGLHHLERFGHDVRFLQPRPEIARLAGIVAARVWGLEPVHIASGLLSRTRRTADVVLTMDERTGLPVAFAQMRIPVVSGVAWLEDPRELSRAHRSVAELGLRRCSAVFVECAAMIDPLVRDFGVPRDRVHFVRLGIDERHFSPSLEPPIVDRVFSVGDDRMRDYDTLNDALRRVQEQRPGMTAEVATTLPVELPPWAEVHRRRMDDAVRACYHRASVVALALHPTRQGSGLTVILEAMASARPVVVTDNPGLEDYVVHGETGLRVPAGDPVAMADAVESLLADPEWVAEMGRRGRRRVEQMFTTRHMAADIDRVLRAATHARG